MIVRKIKPEELKRTNELFAIAFECELDNSKSAEEVYEDVISDMTSRCNFYSLERWAAFEDNNETMISNFILTPYSIQFDGHYCQMIGVGGVATLPQYRRQGGIRECFKSALPAMYENGDTFSYLYPFSTAYYRKFGYEMCCERYCYQIMLSSIPPFNLDGNCYLIEKNTSLLDDIKQVYSVWQEKYNMMVVNEDSEFAWVTKSNPVKDQRFTYVYKNKNGVAKGFITFFKDNTSKERNLKCSRLFFADAEGLKGLLNLVYSYSSDYQYISFELPTDFNLTLILPEWSMGAAKCEKSYCGMVRVINVVQVLKMAKYRGTGSLIMKIFDPLILQNNNIFSVSYQDGIAIDVCILSDTANITVDISLEISDFSRLITGSCDTSAITFIDSVCINTSLEKISKVFYRKPVLITEYF